MIGIYTLVLALVLATPAMAQSTCPSTSATDIITIAGSTTVQPIAAAWGAAYAAQCPGATVNVQGGTSSSGAQRVCGVAPQVDIGAMSRAWKAEEATAGTPSYKYNCVIGTLPAVTQIDVAIESLVVIVKRNSPAAMCIANLGGLTFDQLRWMFSSYTVDDLTDTGWSPSALPNNDNDDGTHLFSELHSNCLPIEIKLVGPTSAFSSYSYFLETILTDNGNTEMFPMAPRYTGTTTETLTINKVKNDLTGASIGYVSFNAHNSVRSTITAVSLKKTTTGSFIAPTYTTIASGTYPLSRRIYMNVCTSTVAKTKAFIQYGMSVMGTVKVIAQGFSPIPVASRATMVARL